MNTNKKTAGIVGVLFMIATVAGILSVVNTGPLREPDYLVNVFANENQIITGALLVIIMGAAIAPIPAIMFPILKKHNEGLALGFVVFRVLEGVTYIATVISMLS